MQILIKKSEEKYIDIPDRSHIGILIELLKSCEIKYKVWYSNLEDSLMLSIIDNRMLIGKSVFPINQNGEFRNIKQQTKSNIIKDFAKSNDLEVIYAKLNTEQEEYGKLINEFNLKAKLQFYLKAAREIEIKLERLK